MANLSHNEIELLKASIQGNTAAFESIVKKYQSYVCAITYSAIPDVEKSEDMAQETFLHVWNNLSKLKDLTKFKSWLITITRNIISDFLKKQKHDLINNAAPIEQIENAQTKQAEPAHQVMTKEQQAVVQIALMQIPEKYREPLVLFYRHEQSVKHIAEQLDLSEELVKQHLSRGRKLLKEQVAAMVEGAIKKTGPTKAFTSVVMASVAGLAVKGTVATAAVAGTSAIMSSISAKIIAAAAVLAIGIGSVVTYNHLTKPGEETQAITPVARVNEVQQETNSETSLPASNINIAANSIQEPTQPEIASAIYANNIANENTANRITAFGNNNSSITNTVPLANEPVDSPYEYFLFTRYDVNPSTKSLVLAHITDNGIELENIVTEDFGSYHWSYPICIVGGKLYGGSYNYLYSLDLTTKQIENYPLRPDKTPNYVFNSLSGASEFCIGDNSLYGLSKNGEKITIRQIDLETLSCRDIADVTIFQPSKDMAISPDNKRLAYFAMDENGSFPLMENGGFSLTIVDIETGKITQPAKPIQFVVPMIASSFPGIPIMWLDSETVVYVRSQTKEDDDEQSFMRSAVNMLTMTNVNTGETEDILALPGSANSGFAPALIKDNVGIGPLIQPKPDYKNNYRLDLENRKLVENDLIAGEFRFAFGNLYYKNLGLGSVKSRYYAASPDGKRIVWMGALTINSETPENQERAARNLLSSDDGTLYYYDEAQDAPAAISKVYNSTGFWIKTEDLNRRNFRTSLTSGWTPLKNITQDVPTQVRVDKRKDIRNYVDCKIETDKTSYLIHEPVEVTLTLTNKSNEDITISKPFILESISKPLVGLTVTYPGGQTSLDSGAQPYSPNNEDILIKAGESFTATDTIEASIAGSYKLEYRYEIPTLQQDFKGYIKTQPAAFNVIAVEDKAEEKKLFEDKFARLMTRYQDEVAMAPEWSGNNNISDEVMGLPGMGTEVIPYIIDALKNETSMQSRQMLLTALSRIADSQYIYYFRERLINGDTYPVVCNWILKAFNNSGTNEDIRKQAIEAFIAGMSNKEVDDRRMVCSYLRKIYDEKIETCFTKTVEDEDEQIKLEAGFYLAAAKWLELTDWLEFALSEFNYVNYISACGVVNKLEQQYNISKGDLPLLSKEDFSNQEAEKQYKKVLGEWLSWSNENQRTSFTFFEDYREIWWNNDPLKQD